MFGQSIELKTAQDFDVLNDEAALITYLELASLDHPIVAQVMKLKRAHNLSTQYTLALLAYHSLVALERTEKAYLDFVNRTPMAPMIYMKPQEDV